MDGKFVNECKTKYYFLLFSLYFSEYANDGDTHKHLLWPFAGLTFKKGGLLGS